MRVCTVNKFKPELLRRVFQEYLLDITVLPIVTPTPEKVDVIWHDYKGVNIDSLIVYKKFQAIRHDALEVILKQEILPVEAGCGKKLYAPHLRK